VAFRLSKSSESWLTASSTFSSNALFGFRDDTISSRVSEGKGWLCERNLSTTAETLDEGIEERCSFNISRLVRNPQSGHEPGTSSSGGGGKGRGSSMMVAVGQKDKYIDGRALICCMGAQACDVTGHNKGKLGSLDKGHNVRVGSCF
jgi:hypothetical protein